MAGQRNDRGLIEGLALTGAPCGPLRRSPAGRFHPPVRAGMLEG
jgi:hypothetical protein